MQTLQTKTLDNLEQLTKQIEEEAKREEKAEKEREILEAASIKARDDNKITLVPSPNFTDVTSVGTYLPVNMADETVTFLTQLNRKFDFVDFVKEKLNYKSRIKVAQSFASEQLDALVMAITSFEKNNAFILGDMAGIGKGRVCAGAMRYAYQKGFIPIFVTHKPYLFSDIYRDLLDIDGLGIDENGKRIEIAPLVMHQDGLVYETDIYGEQIVDPLTGEYKIAFSSLKSKQLDRLIKSETDRILDVMSKPGATSKDITLPKEYNAVFLPYSTIGQTTGRLKQDYLESLAPNSIIIFDESHNAASANMEAKILKRCMPLVESSEGVLFSSATYAKSPAVFNLYVLKTALRTAVPTLDSITNALKVGGENVSEYIATGLVKEGQMIRRERSFSSCNKVTEYVGTIRTDVAGKVIHTDDINDKQKEFFNEAIGYFKELRDFANTPDAKLGIKIAVERDCATKKYDLADLKEFYDIKEYQKKAKVPDADKKNLRDSWIAKNRGKYILKYKEDSITRYKQTFRENLFLSIKAKFTADLILDCLNKEIKYTNIDGTEHYAPMKPLIAMKSTGSAIFNELDLNLGDTLKNDFSEYLLAIYKKLFSGKYELRKVDNDVFTDEAELLRNGIKPNIKIDTYSVLLTDFFDTPNGLDAAGDPTPRQKIIKIQNKLNSYNSEIPFSVIDYLKYRIESTPRNANYYKPGTFDPKYGDASSPFYSLLEATGREEMLEKVDLNDPNSLYVFKKNDRIKSVTDVYKAFNRGAGDVMLINVVASTGGSAQSSSKFLDKRPRNMFIIQTELDVNTEVQKRGRINRTGQVNSPTYTYIVTQIPVEQRLYLMFRKKLRKLDANTSANQTASVEASEITDRDGEAIEDIFNPYGFDVFVESFINIPANSPYKDIYDRLNKKGKASTVIAAQTAAQAAGAPVNPTAATPQVVSRNIAGGEQDEENYEAFNSFVRELELYPVDFQKVFFDEMQMLYKNYVRDLIQKGEYQLELIAREYKAVLKQSTLVQENAGTSTFSSSLFLSDYFTLNDRQVWSRDRVRQKISEIAKNQDPKDRHIKLIEDFERESKIEVAVQRKVYEQYNNPEKPSNIIITNKGIELVGKDENGKLFYAGDATNIRPGQKFVISELHTSGKDAMRNDGKLIPIEEAEKREIIFTYLGVNPNGSLIFIDENEPVDQAAQIRYDANLARYVTGMEEANKAYLKMLKFFTPEKPIIYNGHVGQFLGVVLKDPRGRYKYSPALIDFVFAFLSGYTVMRWNLTGPTGYVLNQKSKLLITNQLIKDSQIGQLQEIVTLTQVYIDSYEAPNAQEYKDQVTAWKADPWLRVVKRFYTGNILSGIVKANEDKSKGGATWQLSRFTNLDGSLTTAVQLNVDSKMIEKVEQFAENVPLSVNAASVRFIKYLQEMPVSKEENSGKSTETMPIWNLPSPMLIVAEKYATRAIAIIKTQVEKKGIYYPVINFEVCQNYVTKTDGTIVDIIPKQRPNGAIDFPTRWNSLYHDDRFADDFDDYMIQMGRQQIKYGVIRTPITSTTKKSANVKGVSIGLKNLGIGQSNYTTELDPYNTLVKRFSFNLLDQKSLDDLQIFLNRLSSDYQVNFEFRASAAAYLNTPVFIDIPKEILTKSAPEQQFEKGEYVYQFLKKQSDDLIKQIPNLKEKRSVSEYGQVVLDLPLTPTQCKTFELIPIYYPDNLVYIKMALAVLQNEEKAVFIKELQDKSKNETAIDVGNFVQKYLAGISVPIKYFFGYQDVYDVGSMFQGYALNQDISKLVSVGAEQAEKSTKAPAIPKDKVTFEDAERFLMFLNP